MGEATSWRSKEHIGREAGDLCRGGRVSQNGIHHGFEDEIECNSGANIYSKAMN